jgi:hypothetical protein
MGAAPKGYQIMADIKLGISGSEVTLSTKVDISLPVSMERSTTKYRMSDGSKRWAFEGVDYRAWQIKFRKLTAAELTSLLGLVALRSVLHFQNNNESASWYDVVITSFSFDTLVPWGTVYYTADLVLEET